jgi:hypothetical protein
LKTLSASKQDALAKPSERIASMILAELEDDPRCDREFAGSPDTLAKLAAPAMAEYHAGKTYELDSETL